jgi:hypothetical protein
MSTPQFDELRESIEQQRRFCQQRSNNNRIAALSLRIGTTCLSAAVTVLLGIKFTDPKTSFVILQNCALVGSATITIVSAVEAFWKPRITWISAQTSAELLEELQRDFNYIFRDRSASDINLSEIEPFKQRLDKILQDDRKTWTEAIRETVPGSKAQ